MTDCDVHEWPSGRLTTTEGLPRCPMCRVHIPGGIGRRPKQRRGRQVAAPAPSVTRPAAPVIDRQSLAAGEHPTLEDL